MGGYWIDSPDNPFNQMSWTRGGGGYSNDATTESNDRRADAMQGAGAAALPHYATPQAALDYGGNGLYVIGGNVVKVTAGPGSSGQSTLGGSGGSGAGSAGVSTGGGGKGAGSRLVISGGPLKPVMSGEATSLLAGGQVLPIDLGWSNIDQFEERYGDSELGNPTWFASWGVAIADMLQGVTDHVRPYAESYRQKHGLPSDLAGGGGWDMLVQGWGNMVDVNASARLAPDGRVWKTGGGF